MATVTFQVHPEGKFVVDVDKNIDINDVSVQGMWEGTWEAWSCLSWPCPGVLSSSLLAAGDPELPRGPAQR